MGTPPLWTDKHLWKQYLPVVLRTRAVTKHNVKSNSLTEKKNTSKHLGKLTATHSPSAKDSVGEVLGVQSYVNLCKQQAQVQKESSLEIRDSRFDREAPM